MLFVDIVPIIVTLIGVGVGVSILYFFSINTSYGTTLPVIVLVESVPDKELSVIEPSSDD